MNMISLEKLKETVLEASELMITEGFDISSKEGYSNIVTSSDIAVQISCAKNWQRYCREAVSCARKRICRTRATNIPGLLTR